MLGIVFLFALLTSTFSKGQTPSFSMTISGSNVTSACAGIGITFTNTSSIDPSKLKWDFGDNYTVRNISSIPHAYNKGGTYTITLTNTTTQAKTTQTVTIYDNPIASFNISDSNVCAGTSINFTSTSSPANSPIVSYSWTFGDGTVLPPSASATASHIYTSSGTFPPILTIRDNNGCASGSIPNKQIVVNNNDIQSSFLANGDKFYSCDNTINLQNTTNEGSKTNITYLWDFGDNTTSTDKNPQNHTYTNKGIYNISLQVKFDGLSGCTPIITRKVYIGSPALTLTAQSNICQNSSASIGITSDINNIINSTQDWTLTASNGASINTPGIVTFNNAGNTLLTATNLIGCPSPTTLSVNVLPTPSFSVNLTPSSGICVGVDVIANISVTNGLTISKYIWHPEGVNGTIHTTTAINNNVFAYPNPGQYNYAVEAFATNGCPTIQSTNIAITPECIDNGQGSTYNPVFSFSSASCADKYTITITNKNPTQAVSYWQIGNDKYPATNGQYAIIQLTPQIKGYIYQVSTYYQNNTYDLNRKITIIDETANFTIVNNDNSTLYCANNNFSFITTGSINADNISSYAWKISDAQNTIIATGNTPNLSYSFPLAGQYTISLLIKDIRTPSCESSISKTIDVKGLSGDFEADKNSFCDQNPIVNFQTKNIVSVSSLSSIIWSFGDGSQASSSPTNISSISHQYNSNNASYNGYDVNCRITDASGCFVNITKSQFIQTYNPQIGFSTVDTLLCNTKTVVINNTSNAVNAQYTWTVGGQSQTTVGNQAFSFNFGNLPIPSDLDVVLHLVDGGGCTKDTIVKNYIRYRYPVANYNISNLDVFATCPPFTLDIKNTSKDYDAIQWTINDNFNSIQKDSFYYTVLHPGPVSINLTATLDGCVSAPYNEHYTAKGPVAQLLTKDSIGCTPYTTLLYVSDKSDIVSYQWDKGDGITYITDKTSDSMRFTYDVAGTYYPSVTFVGTEGCSDRQQFRSPIIALQSVDLQYKNNYLFCSNDSTLHLTVNGYATSYTWTQTPTTGYMSETQGNDIGVRPTENTTYHIAAQSGNICPNETGDISVKWAQASEVSFTPNTITQPAGTVFTFTPTVTHLDLGVQYYWSPGYRINNRYLMSPTIVADNDTTYYLNVKNQNGCTSTASLHVHVLCNSSKLLMANAFTPNGDGKNDRFYVTGYGIKNVARFLIVDRWGNKIFERTNIAANDISQGWDGNINGKQAAPGTYIYLAEVQCTEGNVIPLKGSVVLIR